MKYLNKTSSHSLHSNLRFLNFLGTVNARSMFGGYGLFVDGVFFAFFTNNRIHLKAGNKTKLIFDELGIRPYVYFKRNHLVTTNYYPIPLEWLDNIDELEKHSLMAISEARESRTIGKENKNNHVRIKDLLNLKLSTERLLRQINIENAHQLKEKGAIETFTQLANNNREIDIKLLFMLEGAIIGQHWSVVFEDKCQDLMNALPLHIRQRWALERKDIRGHLLPS